MDLRQLRYFVAVAEHASISLAAQAVHIVQPALSRQMQALEDEIGTKLLERGARGVGLTDAGKQLLADAHKLLDDAAAAKERAQRAGRGAIGHLSLGLPVLQNVSPTIAGILKTYRKEVPEVAITFRHLLSEAQVNLILDGQLDAGFLVFRPLDNALLEGIPVFSERMLLAYPTGWKWPQGMPRSLKDLQEVDFIWLPRSVAPAWHDKLIHCFFEAGFVPRATVHGVDASSMMTLVAAGMGCTVLPESAKDHASRSITFAPLSDLDVRQDWELVWRTDRCSSTLQRFLSVVSAHLARRTRHRPPC